MSEWDTKDYDPIYDRAHGLADEIARVAREIATRPCPTCGPAPDPDREAVEAIREASWSIPPKYLTWDPNVKKIVSAAKPDPLPGLPESRDLLHSLRAKGWDLVKRDL